MTRARPWGGGEGSRRRGGREGSRPWGGGDEGSGSVLVVGLTALLLALTVLVLALGAAVAARHRAETAADLAALAGADVVLGRAAGDACTRAREVVVANGARFAGCAVQADATVLVAAVVPLPGAFAAVGEARAQARAGAGRGPQATEAIP